MGTYSVIKIIGRRIWMVLLLWYIGFFALAWSVPVFAAELKDVRVGEYKGFTRIVFELNERAIKPEIKIQSSNHLLVTFNKTIANLVRNIPVERSPNVDDIQFWQHKSSLSTLLIFDYPYIRLESFRLSRPARFAVDVFPVAVPITEKSSGPTARGRIDPKDNRNKNSKMISKQTSVIIGTHSEPTSEPSDKGSPPKLAQATVSASDSKQHSDDNSLSTKGSIPALDNVDNRVSTAMQKKTDQSYVQTLPNEGDKSGTPEHGGPTSASSAGNDASTVSVVENVKVPMLPTTTLETEHDTKQTTDKTTQKTASSNNRLQFYLVIILVIITIAILLLLLLMLLTRHQLFYDKETLRSAEITQHQDKNIIAKIDSNLKEELKRYDKA
jgi:hypothetical protein